MSPFPHTTVGGVSVPRLICGTNWFLGYSHTSQAKNRTILDIFDDPSKIADVIEVFARHSCNAVMSPVDDRIVQAMREVEQRTGIGMIWICTPGFCEGPEPDAWKRQIDEARAKGATFSFPHESVTDLYVDVTNRCLAPKLIERLNYVRETGMVPGLSTHKPEAIVCADACDADVESYIQPYNAAGFLCQVETDWIQQIIHGARRPVMTIKPLAAGRLLPPTGLAFVWNTIRDCDMVTIGTMSTYEAEESIELSLACLERRKAGVKLQYTRSKKNLVAGTE